MQVQFCQARESALESGFGRAELRCAGGGSVDSMTGGMVSTAAVLALAGPRLPSFLVSTKTGLRPLLPHAPGQGPDWLCVE